MSGLKPHIWVYVLVNSFKPTCVQPILKGFNRHVRCRNFSDFDWGIKSNGSDVIGSNPVSSKISCSRELSQVAIFHHIWYIDFRHGIDVNGQWLMRFENTPMSQLRGCDGQFDWSNDDFPFWDSQFCIQRNRRRQISAFIQLKTVFFYSLQIRE